MQPYQDRREVGGGGGNYPCSLGLEGPCYYRFLKVTFLEWICTQIMTRAHSGSWQPWTLQYKCFASPVRGGGGGEAGEHKSKK